MKIMISPMALINKKVTCVCDNAYYGFVTDSISNIVGINVCRRHLRIGYFRNQSKLSVYIVGYNTDIK